MVHNIYMDQKTFSSLANQDFIFIFRSYFFMKLVGIVSVKMFRNEKERKSKLESE